MLNSLQMLKCAFCDQACASAASGSQALGYEHITFYEHYVGKTLDNREALNQFLASVERRAFRMAEIGTSSHQSTTIVRRDPAYRYARDLE